MKPKLFIISLVILGVWIVTALVNTSCSRPGKQVTKSQIIAFVTLASSFEELLEMPGRGSIVGPSLPVSYSETSQIEELRTSFIKEWQGVFCIVEDEIITEGSQKFWLLTIEPQKTGFFTIRHIYETARSSVLVIYDIAVTRAGSKRTYISAFENERYHKFSRYYRDMCLGDCISLPINMGKGTQKHEFEGHHTFKKHSGWLGWNLNTPNDPQKTIKDIKYYNRNANKVYNPAKYALDYKGQTTGVDPVIMRDLTGDYDEYFYTAYAIFEAKRPGEFNLKITPRNTVHTKKMKQPYIEKSIIIVAREEPITIWPCWASFRDWSKMPMKQTDPFALDLYRIET